MRENPEAVDRLAQDAEISMTYRNWRGEVSQRTIRPVALWFGKTEWHPEPGWLLNAWDCGKGERRDFALADCQFDVAGPLADGYSAALDEIDRLRAVVCNAIEVIRITISGIEKNSPVPVDLLGIWHRQLREELSGNAGPTSAQVCEMHDANRHAAFEVSDDRE